MSVGVTELPNDLTNEMDMSTPVEMIRLLRQSDAQLFAGWKNFPSINDEEILAQMNGVILRMSSLFQDPKSLVVFSGAGTSGRLGFFCAHAFNALLEQQPNCGTKFDYLIAGGDKALKEAQEQSEDNIDNGRRDLLEMLGLGDWVNGMAPPTPKYNQVLYFGITCGLSAPYVAAQLDLVLALHQQGLNYHCALVGCNPLSLARSVPIPGWNRTFRDVAALVTSPHFLINPVVGPEAICGSSRMKGGSITKIILETIFILAYRHTFSLQPKLSLVDVLAAYELTCRWTYQNPQTLARAIEAAGKSLCSGHRVIYASDDIGLSLLAMIDASECPPTFGADPTDIQAIFQHQHRSLPITLAATTQCQEGDTLVIFTLAQKGQDLTERWKGQASSTFIVTISTELSASSTQGDIPICIPSLGLLPGMHHLAEISCKWIVNAISTGAHVLRGKILGNRMIDLKLSNHKLWDRAIRLVEEGSKVDAETALAALLRVVYEIDDRSPSALAELKQSEVANHVSAAFSKRRVVPRSILLILKEKEGKETSIAEVTREVEAQPRVRLLFRKEK